MLFVKEIPLRTPIICNIISSHILLPDLRNSNYFHLLCIMASKLQKITLTATYSSDSKNDSFVLQERVINPNSKLSRLMTVRF